MSQKTIGVLLRAAQQLLQNVSDAPQQEARYLLSLVLGQSTAWLLAHDDEMLSDAQFVQWEDYIQQRITGKPLAYIAGKQAFYHWDFGVSEAVLIPRQETEELVERAYQWAQIQAGPLTIVDVGTGSGAIAISLALLLPEARVLATDISADALVKARKNAVRLSAKNVQFFEGNLLSALPAKTRIDLLVANLPYIAHEDLAALAVTKWEPALALDGGQDGLVLIRQLLEQAPPFLCPNSQIMLEIGADQGDFFRELSSKFAAVEVHQDLAGRDRMVMIQPMETHPCL